MKAVKRVVVTDVSKNNQGSGNRNGKTRKIDQVGGFVSLELSPVMSDEYHECRLLFLIAQI